jgi:hypothetical protein
VSSWRVTSYRPTSNAHLVNIIISHLPTLLCLVACDIVIVVKTICSFQLWGKTNNEFL